jgi:hypothetical protein
MNFQQRDIRAAAEAGIFTTEQAVAFETWLSARYADVASFRPAHILYYLGGLIAVGAVSLFITLAWESWAGAPMLLLALGFAGLGIALAHRFLRGGFNIPAGIMVTLAVATTPLAVYSFQHLIGFWDAGHVGSVTDFHRYIDWRWFFMEMATLIAAAIALWRYRMPFLLMPVGVVLWYLSMDLVPLIFQDLDRSWELRRLVTMHMGLLTLGLAFWIDVRSGREKDYAFWLYLFGVLMFWGGLSLMESTSELGKFLYCMINLVMIATGALLMRRVFAVFGALGVAGYLFHLADLFSGSLLFPVWLAAIGIGIVFAGLFWQRNEARIHMTLLNVLPAPVRRLVERAHGG